MFAPGCGRLNSPRATITAEVPDAPITIFTSNFNNQGTLVAANGGSFIFQNAPGFGPNPANLDVRGSLRADTSSSLEASGWIHCFPASTTEFTLGPAVPNQPIVSAGNDFRADGTLRIRFNPNFVPAAGNSWRLFTGEAISGQFSTLDLSPLPPGLGWNTSDLGSGFISIEPTCLWLGNGCFPDFTSDGSIDGDDVIAFFANWDDADPCADVDLSSGVDGDDVIAFFNAWDQAGAGVPGCE